MNVLTCPLVVVLVSLFLFVFCYFNVPHGKVGSPYLVRHSIHRSSATHCDQSVCSTSRCPNNGMVADSAWDFYLCTDVDACDCTEGLCGHRKRVSVATKSIATLGASAHISIAPGFSVGCCTNRAIPISW